MTEIRLVAFSAVGSIMTVLAASAQTAFYAASQDDFYQTVTNADIYARPLLDNTVRKTGAGDLSLQNPRMPRGGLDVRAGSVTVSFTNAWVPPELPVGIQQKVSFWVDANTNVVTDGEGNVERWHDVREPSVTGPDFLYMMATNDVASRRPARVSDPGLGGKNYLDFGKWGGTLYSNDNARFLFMTTSNAVLRNSFYLRTVFIVFGSHNGNGLGGGISLIQNNVSLSPESAPWAGQTTQLWIGNNANVIADDGMNWLDREMIHGYNVQVKDKAYHLINVNTPIGARANTFGYDRGLLAYSGGARICEALFFTDELSEAERLQAEDYLWHKWFARDDSGAGACRLAEDATLNLDLDDVSRTVRVSGGGTLNKTGSGTLVLNNGGTDAFDGTVRLREGSLLSAGEPCLLDLEEGGQALSVDGPTIQRVSGGQPEGTVAISGTGSVAVASIADGITRLAVSEGTLRLAAPRVPPAACPDDASVNDPSLESFTNGVASAVQWVNFTPLEGPHVATVNGWTFDRSAYASSGNFLIGIVFDACPAPIVEKPFPDGNAALYVNCGKVSTGFTVPVSGHYRLVFQMAARNSSSLKRDVNVMVDDVTLRTITALDVNYWKYAVRLPWLSAGPHTVAFEGFGPDFTKVAIIDDISVQALSAAEEEPVIVSLANPGFEMPVAWLDAGIVVTNASAPWSDGGWTFENLSGIGRLQAVGSNRSMPAAMPDGLSAGFITTNGVIRQTVSFPAAGQYRLTFETAGRVALIGHTFEVRLGGTVLKRITTRDRLFRTEEILLPPVSEGESLELAFVGVTSALATASLIDDIRVERVSDEIPNALANGGFESGTNSWSFTGLAGITNNTNPWKVAVPEGTNEVYLSMNAGFSQQVTFGQGGAYAVSFYAQCYYYTDFGRFHDYDILWDGQPIGRFLNVTPWLYRFTLPLPSVAEGSTHTLQVRGVDSYGVNTGSCFDGFRIEPYVARARRSLDGRFPETVALDIAEGATLDLDFDGVLKIQTVRYAGHSVSGTISAATHPEFVSGEGALSVPPKGTVIGIL